MSACDQDHGRVGERRSRSVGPHPRSAGFTLIEVMMAVAIMTVGSVGIMALVQATTRGNMTAREMTTATQLTDRWIERLHRDAINWTQSGRPLGPPTDYLFNAPVAAIGLGAWFSPMTPAGSTDSFGADYQGNDTSVIGDMYYCTNIRLSWVINQQALRADVRTWWHRSDDSANRMVLAGCNGGAGGEAAVSSELDSATPRLRAVYGSTLLRWTRLVQ